MDVIAGEFVRNVSLVAPALKKSNLDFKLALADHLCLAKLCTFYFFFIFC